MRRSSREYFQCDKCGKEVEYEVLSNNYEDEIARECCWTIDLGVAGYGSVLDGCNVEFDLCDECLSSFIATFIHKDRVYV